MKKSYFSLLIAIIMFAFFSCKKEVDNPVDMGYDYFPVNVGHWAVYIVDSTYYNDFTDSVEVYQYKIKEYVESDFTDNQNRKTQRIERYKQVNDTSNWYINNVWAVNLTPATAEKVEEDYRFIKLIFKLKENKTWNGNAYNILDEQEYRYKNIYKPYTVNGITFDSTVTVIQNVNSNLIQEFNQVEVYARHVGLIYKRYKAINKINGVIKKGVDYTYSIVSFGD